MLKYPTFSSSLHSSKPNSVPKYTSTIPLRTLVVKENKTWRCALYLGYTFLLSLFLFPHLFQWPQLTAFSHFWNSILKAGTETLKHPISTVALCMAKYSAEQNGLISRQGSLQWNLFGYPTLSNQAIASFLLRTNRKGGKRLIQRRLARLKENW